MKKHQKHTSLVRPPYGEFHRQEWAFLGAPCTLIQDWSARIIADLQADFRLAYVDADHAEADAVADSSANLPFTTYTDKIGWHRYDRQATMNAYQQRQQFLDCDAVLVNGNHFLAKAQIVILDPRKAESLSRKLDRLTDVQLILTTDDQTEVYDFLQHHLGEGPIDTLPLRATADIIQWFRQQLESSIAPVQGLVLAGGKSERMGQDKATLTYHGLPEYQRMAQLVQHYCPQTYLSLRPDQHLEGDWPRIDDTFMGLGPFGAICSAFRQNPNTAWLVVACDLPLLDKDTLDQLMAARDASRVATAIHNPATGWPDPLVTIWEPRAYPMLLQFLAQAYSCPRKVLINADIQLLHLADASGLQNVNHPEERETILRQLADS